MERLEDSGSTIKINGGFSTPPNINPNVLTKAGRKKKKKYSVDEYVDGILSGNRTILSQAITLAESSLACHAETAQHIIERCLPFASGSVRIGITGAPGSGKSTFIETFGLFLTGQGKKLAVLAIDPSSGQTGGSILGDKTRMEKLSVNDNAFIRPSPSAGTLGGVAGKTKQAIILCEAAGFDIIIVETVGVGQSETSVRTMVDFFLLLLLAGAGDELQGIKRGVMEMADCIAITKADGSNKMNAERAKISFQNALNLFPPSASGWKPTALTCSAHQGTGIAELWNNITDYISFTKKSGYFERFRKEQEIAFMHDLISESLNNSFYNNERIKLVQQKIEKQLYDGTITPQKAAFELLDKYFRR